MFNDKVKSSLMINFTIMPIFFGKFLQLGELFLKKKIKMKT
jgi:hypothetical protein